MKDIKELIYAAVEENALKFQELVNAQLQVRAYDAIEALRPEVGASMFGESSHKKMNDDEDEEDMEDEEDEDEDEDKKKSKVEEELKGKQHKIDKNKNGKIDAHDFKLLRQEEVEVDEAVRIRDRSYSSIERDHGDDKKTFQGQMDRKHIAAGAKARRKRTGPGVKGFNSAMRPAKASDGYQPRETGSVRAKNEEVEQIDEIGDTPKGREALGKLASQRFGRARWAAGVHRATSRSDGGASPHSRLQDKDSEVGKKAADKAGIAHRDVPDHNYDYEKKGGYGTKVADPAHKFAARNKPKMEEVGLDEVAMPKNAADWQALITHQIQTTGHPVATDAQFRATTVGKDTSKIASLEPGEDKLQYATAQGGTVKQ